MTSLLSKVLSSQAAACSTETLSACCLCRCPILLNTCPHTLPDYGAIFSQCPSFFFLPPSSSHIFTGVETCALYRY